MSEFKHDAESIKEAIGLDPTVVLSGMSDIVLELKGNHRGVFSREVELFEKLPVRELAMAAAMLIKKINEEMIEDEPSHSHIDAKIRTMKVNVNDVPPEIREKLDEMIKESGKGIFAADDLPEEVRDALYNMAEEKSDETCMCPDCVSRRGRNEDKKVVKPYPGEGGHA